MNDIIKDDELIQELMQGKSTIALLTVDGDEYEHLIQILEEHKKEIKKRWPEIRTVVVEIDLELVETLSACLSTLKIYGNRMVEALIQEKEGFNDRPSSSEEDREKKEESQEDSKTS